MGGGDVVGDEVPVVGEDVPLVGDDVPVVGGDVPLVGDDVPAGGVVAGGGWTTGELFVGLEPGLYTITSVEAVTDPMRAVTSAVPGASPTMNPLDVTLTTAGSDERQAAPDRFRSRARAE